MTAPDEGWRALPAPVPPTDVSATDGTYLDRVEVSWTPVPWATGYHVSRDGVRITDTPIESAAFTDSGADAGALPAPGSVSATTNREDAVVLTFAAPPTGAPGSTHRYAVETVQDDRVSDPSASDEGFRAARTVAGYEVALDRGPWLPVGGSPYNDATAPTPSIAPATVTASDGTFASYVQVTRTEPVATPGADRVYGVRAVDATGTPGDVASATGRRTIAGFFTRFQYATSPEGPLTQLSTTTSAAFNDFGAPANGGARWYAAQTTSSLGTIVVAGARDEGWRTPPALAPPIGLVASDGTFTTHVALSWTPPRGADAIRVFRDGEIIAELDGGAARHDDWDAPEPAELPIPGITSASATASGATVRWTLPGVPSATPNTYAVAAVYGESVSTSATDAGWRQANITSYELRVDGGDWVDVGLVSEWVYTGPTNWRIRYGSLSDVPAVPLQPPGSAFMNLRVDPAWSPQQVELRTRRGETRSASAIGSVEYVDAPPEFVFEAQQLMPTDDDAETWESVPVTLGGAAAAWNGNGFLRVPIRVETGVRWPWRGVVRGVVYSPDGSDTPVPAIPTGGGVESRLGEPTNGGAVFGDWALATECAPGSTAVLDRCVGTVDTVLEGMALFAIPWSWCAPGSGCTANYTFPATTLVGRTEVTRAQFESVLGAPPGAGVASNGCDSGDCPAAGISYFAALQFANALSTREGHEVCYVFEGCTAVDGVYTDCVDATLVSERCPGYRIVTEPLMRMLMHRASANGTEAWLPASAGGVAHPVGTSAEQRGLFDIAGNVAEWTETRFAAGSPASGTDPVGPLTGRDRVVLGSSFVSTSTTRIGVDPADVSNARGFRVVRREWAGDLGRVASPDGCAQPGGGPASTCVRWPTVSAGCALPTTVAGTGRQSTQPWYRDDARLEWPLIDVGHPFVVAVREVTRLEWQLAGFSLPLDLPESPCVAERCPVTGITWWDAARFTNYLSEREGREACYVLGDCSTSDGVPGAVCGSTESVGVVCRGYRLPTEAERRYASGLASTGLAHVPAEAGVDAICPLADLSSSAEIRSLGTTEWTESWYAPIPWEEHALVDYFGPATGTERVLVGIDPSVPEGERVASLRRSAPPETQSPYVGFRFVRTLHPDEYAE